MLRCNNTTYLLNQHKGLRLNRRFSATPKHCAHHACHHWFCSALCCAAHCPWEFSKVQLLVNAVDMFRVFYRGHFSHDFRAQGVTLKRKALATKYIFQNYSKLLDICTRLVLNCRGTFCAKCTWTPIVSVTGTELLCTYYMGLASVVRTILKIYKCNM